ncbi:AI-2E family transporter [Candidatus Woesearchaeota archaeon]|nr:AI-2E family transporter [Candidatus Woesearchaeota archaeon]
MQEKKGWISILAYLAILIISFFVIRPYITALLTAFVFSYLTLPLHNFLKKKIKSNSISAFIVTCLAVVVLIVPTYFIARELVNQSLRIYNIIMGNDALQLFMGQFGINLETITGALTQKVYDSAILIAKSLPQQILGFVIAILFMYYFLRDHDKLLEGLKSIIPLHKEHKESLFLSFKNVTNSVIYGLVFTGILEAVLLTIVFYIFKVEAPLFWGLIVFVLALLPLLGPTLVWIPIVIVKYISGDIVGAVAIGLFGIFIMSTIENIIRPKIIGDRAGIHPGLILLGVMGGISLFGFIGIIIGPLMLSFGLEILKFYGKWR